MTLWPLVRVVPLPKLEGASKVEVDGLGDK